MPFHYIPVAMASKHGCRNNASVLLQNYYQNVTGNRQNAKGHNSAWLILKYASYITKDHRLLYNEIIWLLRKQFNYHKVHILTITLVINDGHFCGVHLGWFPTEICPPGMPVFCQLTWTVINLNGNSLVQHFCFVSSF